MKKKDRNSLIPTWRKYFAVGSTVVVSSLILIIFISICLIISREKSFLNSSSEDLMSYAENNLVTCFKSYEERIGSSVLAEQLYDRYTESESAYKKMITKTMDEICRESRHVTGVTYVDKSGWRTGMGVLGGDWDKRIKLIDECRKSETFIQRKKIWRYTDLTAGYKRIAFCRDIIYLDESYSMHYIGTMLVLFDAEKIRSEYLSNDDENVVLCFCDEKDTIALSNKVDIIGREFEEVFSENRYSLKTADSAIEGFTKKTCVNMHMGLYDSYRVILVVLGMVVCYLGVIIFIEYTQFKNWGKPMEKICSYIYVNSDGVVDFSREYNGDSEVLYIKRFVENAIETAQDYMAKNYEIQLELKNMTIKAYENQINPHFLFNTLQIIQMLSVIGENKKVERMISSLAGIMRFNLSKNQTVTIREEISNLKNYMYILEMRYVDRLNYKILIPEHMYDYACIKFLLQPIIENTVSHGFKGHTGNMEIVITGYEMNGEAAIVVKDNGRGMSEAALKELKERLKKNNVGNSQGHGIGLANIDKRLKLIYGMQYGVDIFGKEGMGMQVLLHFRMQKYIPEGDDKSV